MAAIDKLRCRYYSDFKDFVVWCMIYKPSLLNNFYYPFTSSTEWDNWQKECSTNTDYGDDRALTIASFRFNQDKYLYWHCPLDFVREYLETQCGYKKANWFVKLFWKY